jgi:hypothetical protein
MSEENHGRLFTVEGGRGGYLKWRWVQGITDDLQMSALDEEHLAYDQVVFTRAVTGEKFHQRHAEPYVSL